jgi:tetratricopeptide (TPR) repeat protein
MTRALKLLSALPIGISLSIGAAAPALATQGGADQVISQASLSGSYLAGRFAGKQRDNAIAALYFQRALEVDPGNPVLIERAFVLDLGAGNMQRAELLAEQVAKFNPQHRMARIVLGLKAFREKNYKVARDHFSKAAFTPVGELTSGLLNAWVFAAEGKFPEAMRALDVLDKQEAFVNFKLFHAALIADLLRSETGASGRYRTAYEKAGVSLRVVQAYGNFLERQGNKDEARKVYGQFLAVSQRNPLVREQLDQLNAGQQPRPFVGSASDGAAEALFSLASALSDEQSIDIALVYAQLALMLKPDFAVARTLLGEIYEDIQRHDLAIEVYEKVKETSVLRASAEIQIATNLDALGKSDEAIEELRKLVEREPGNYDAQLSLGNVLRSHEKWAEAADAYTNAIAALGSSFGKKQWSLLYFRGISYERAGAWEKAEADFRKALEFEPEQPQVLNYLGYSLIDKGKNLSEALEMVKKAVELRPNDGYIVDSLGWAYYKLGDYEEAVKQLERAVELRPEDPVINDHFGDALWRVGRRLEAKFQWQHAKDNKPESKDLANIQRKISEGLGDLPKAPPAASGDNQRKL